MADANPRMDWRAVAGSIFDIVDQREEWAHPSVGRGQILRISAWHGVHRSKLVNRRDAEGPQRCSAPLRLCGEPSSANLRLAWGPSLDFRRGVGATPCGRSFGPKRRHQGAHAGAPLQRMISPLGMGSIGFRAAPVRRCVRLFCGVAQEEVGRGEGDDPRARDVIPRWTWGPRTMSAVISIS